MQRTTTQGRHDGSDVLAGRTRPEISIDENRLRHSDLCDHFGQKSPRRLAGFSQTAPGNHLVKCNTMRLRWFGVIPFAERVCGFSEILGCGLEAGYGERSCSICNPVEVGDA